MIEKIKDTGWRLVKWFADDRVYWTFFAGMAFGWLASILGMAFN